MGSAGIKRLLMIQAKELRIGNWVSIERETFDGEHELKYVRVYSIPDHDTVRITEDMKVFLEVPIELVQGIVITHEILDACGFKRNASYWEVPDAFFEILWQWIDEEDTYTITIDQTIFTSHFRYVHQLQNIIFALTGDEINLDKIYDHEN